uniref:UPAR/Ly6 domain-containing protein n=1 Tax=Calidris pygmaea TaxID=425635 RepID=A0A8C3JNW0_9CHAR
MEVPINPIQLPVLTAQLGYTNALYCYTCEWEQSNWSCLKAKKCSDKDEYCVTNVASVGIGMCNGCVITKKCSETCPHHNFSLGLASYTSYCCQTFLCNLSAYGRESHASVLLHLCGLFFSLFLPLLPILLGRGVSEWL